MFLTQTHEYSQTLNENSTEKALYDIITENAVGHENSISKNEIQRLLESYGHNCSKQFVTSRITASRRQPHFLGIKRYGGIYIIDSEQDATLTCQYYYEQLQGIRRHFNYLRGLCRRYGFNIE